MVVSLPLDAIEVNPHNPRLQLDQEELLALANSIAQHGILQPILVTASPGRPGRFRLITGERRWRASRLAKRVTIPAIIADGGNEAQLREIQLDENLQRVQLTPLEEGGAFKALQEEYGYSIATLAQRFRRSQSFIRDRLALLSLSPGVQQTLADGRLAVGAALALRTVEDEAVQSRLAHQIVEERFTVEQAQNLVRSYRREQRLAALRLKRRERRALLIQQLSERGPVVTSESYRSEKHHRIWDLNFPECASCPLKGCFLRDDNQVEDVCMVPDCYTTLLERSRRSRLEALDHSKQDRQQAFSRLLASEEVTDAHLLYLLWVMVHSLFGPMSSPMRAELGLPAYSRFPAAGSADCEVLCTWPSERVLTTVFSLVMSTLAGLSNEVLPHGMKQNLITHFGLPPQVLGINDGQDSGQRAELSI